MSARSQATRWAQAGGVEEDVTVSHFGSPERLCSCVRSGKSQPGVADQRSGTYLMDVTSHPLATAYLQMREPRKPLPPHTIILFVALADILGGN